MFYGKVRQLSNLHATLHCFFLRGGGGQMEFQSIWKDSGRLEVIQVISQRKAMEERHFRKKDIVDIDSHIISGTGGSKIMKPFKIMSKPNENVKLFSSKLTNITRLLTK